MSKADADVLRDLAAVVTRWGITGAQFPAYVDEMQRRHNRDVPAPVRQVAALVRWRRPDATPRAIAGLLRRAAAPLAKEG